MQLADVRAFNSAISAVARGAGWWSALKVLRTMEAARFRPRRPPGRGSDAAAPSPAQLRVHPDARSCGPILMAASRAHVAAGAGAHRRRDGAAWHRPRQLRWVCRHHIAGAFERPTVVQGARATAAHPQPERGVLHRRRGVCVAALEGTAALALLDEMEERGVQPDARCLQTIAWAAGRGDGWSAALATLRRMRSEGHVVDAADFLGVALAVCEGEVATFALLNAARDEGVDVDPLSFYSAVVQGWQGQTGQTPAEASVSVLRGLASGQLFLTSDLRAWNLLCEAATDASEPSEEVEAEEDDEQGEGDADARDNGGEAAAPDALSQAEVGAGRASLRTCSPSWTRRTRAPSTKESLTRGLRRPMATRLTRRSTYTATRPSSRARRCATSWHGCRRRPSPRRRRGLPRKTARAGRGWVIHHHHGARPRLDGRRSPRPCGARAYLAGLSPPVTAHTVDGNDGRLRVDPESLQRWLSAKEHEASIRM